ncbi:MAG: hypothetical protein GY820_32145 [Gammaproteobacteria bacterium]|nr:hypothetical protein [Gammaproteobacteria bacterium]
MVDLLRFPMDPLLWSGGPNQADVFENQFHYILHVVQTIWNSMVPTLLAKVQRTQRPSRPANSFSDFKNFGYGRKKQQSSTNTRVG